MELTYTLAGLDCPHCSAKIEQEVGMLEGVHSSAVNLIRQELTIETEHPLEYITGKITELVHRHEPDVEVVESDDTNTAINASLMGYEYVITNSSEPIKAGQYVRLANDTL